MRERLGGMLRGRLAGAQLAALAGLAASAGLLAWALAQPSAEPAAGPAAERQAPAEVRPAATTDAGPGVRLDPGAAADRSSVADSDGRVAFWRARVAADPGDTLSAIHLADALIERSRLTGDLADLERARAVLAAARETAPDAAAIDLREAQVAFALHEFAAAREIAERLLEADPADATLLALLGDAALELGDEAAAGEAYELLAERSASPAAWSRLGRHAFLRGEVERAIELVERAAEAAPAEGFDDATAFYHVQLADLLRGQGRLDEAEAAYRAALAVVPRHAPALAGLGRTREAQGDRQGAIRLLAAATERLPSVEWIAALGDLHALDGDPAAAEEQYRLVDGIAEIAKASGSAYDRQYVLFLADHERDVERAVELATAELAERTDVYGHDALAWALYRAGRLEEAARSADEALRLGTPDGRILYHAGLIAAARGRTDEARELLIAAEARSAALPPLQVEALEDALAELRAGE